jgi:hypothetical protein
MRRFGFVAVLLASTGCALVAPVASNIPVTRETTTECARHCADLGLRLGAVVLVHNSAGCVCEADRPVSSSGRTGGAAVAAAQAIVDDEQAAATQQAQQSTGTSGHH